MTSQEQMKDILSKSGIPAKEIKVFGSQILITCHGEEAARKFAGLLSNFCSTVRGPVKSYDDNKVNTNTVMLPSKHIVWRVGGAI